MVGLRCARVVSLLCTAQPKQIHEIKDFLLTARRKDAKCKSLHTRASPPAGLSAQQLSAPFQPSPAAPPPA